MHPNKIMIIRHAEKPIPGKVGGVRARGQSDDASLSPLGWQRAGALVNFFEQPRSAAIRRPDHLFAVRFDIADVAGSRRPKQTLRPLGASLGIDVNDRFGKDQEAKLVQAVDQLDGSVLIAWSHENILKITTALAPGVPVPAKWPDDRFDVVWVFDRSGQRLSFSQVPQRLLAGDADAGIAFDGES